MLGTLPARDRRKVAEKIDELAGEPRPQGVKALKGKWGEYLRVRCGVYRVVYRVEAEILRVLVVRIGHRREVYRGLP